MPLMKVKKFFDNPDKLEWTLVPTTSREEIQVFPTFIRMRGVNYDIDRIEEAIERNKSEAKMLEQGIKKWKELYSKQNITKRK